MRDGATVGELLHGADRQARDVLWDAGHLDAERLAVAWADFACASATALAAIPNPALSTALVCVKLGSHAKTVGRLPLPASTPDPRLERAAALTWRAQSLLSTYATRAATLGDAQRRDADAARLRIIQTVYIAAHGVSLALREATAHGRPPSCLRALGQQVDAIEQVTGSYVQRHAAAFAGEHTMTPEAGALAEALGQWNLAAHQSLDNPDVSTADLIGIARTNAALLLSTGVIIAAAGEAGLVNPVDLATRVTPGLDAAVTAWTALAQDWQDSRLATANQRARIDTLAADSQLHQALREITRNGSGWASPALIASRADLALAVRDLAHATSGVADLARRYTAVPGDLAHAGRLSLPARHLVDLENRAHASRFAEHGSTPKLPVSSSDVAHNRDVPPTPRLLARLEALARRTVTRMDASCVAVAMIGRPAGRPEVSRAQWPTAYARPPAAIAPSPTR